MVLRKLSAWLLNSISFNTDERAEYCLVPSTERWVLPGQQDVGYQSQKRLKHLDR
jgi:hypothetical protein